jgi:hypothetical protein
VTPLLEDPLLEDPPTAPSELPLDASPAPNGALKLPTEQTRSCESCGAPLAEEQQWCLQCGAPAPGSIVRERDWRPLAVLAGAAALVLAGAATAAALALGQHPSKPPTHLVIAQVPAVTAAPPTTPTPGSTLPTTPGAGTGGVGTPPGAGKSGSTLGTGKGTAGLLPSGTVKPPKLPAVVPTPHALSTPRPSSSTPTPTPTTTPTGTTPTGTGTTPSGSGTSGTSPSRLPNPILLDTDAASTYNPSGYPASYFGDPSLAIDGETSTAWTAQVEPKVAPLMAAGLALDLKSPTRVGSLEVITTTPGMSVEVFGSNAAALPETITDPAWTKLAPKHLIKKKKGLVKLGTGNKAYRFLVLWLVKAPTSAVGTPTAPGHVSISEVVPYPPAPSAP